MLTHHYKDEKSVPELWPRGRDGWLDNGITVQYIMALKVVGYSSDPEEGTGADKSGATG